jgi:hypothetical protein
MVAVPLPVHGMRLATVCFPACGCEGQHLIDVVKLDKGAWWMPRRPEAMKDVAACDKLRGVGKRALIRRFLNGATPHP